MPYVGPGACVCQDLATLAPPPPYFPPPPCSPSIPPPPPYPTATSTSGEQDDVAGVTLLFSQSLFSPPPSAAVLFLRPRPAASRPGLRRPMPPFPAPARTGGRARERDGKRYSFSLRAGGPKKETSGLREAGMGSGRAAYYGGTVCTGEVFLHRPPPRELERCR